MGDKSPKNIKKRALRVAQKGKPTTGATPAPANGIIEAIVKPAR